VKRTQWSDALAAFEASSKLFPSATTTLNMGACERALGRYVRARATLARALAEDEAQGRRIPESSVAEAKGFIAEIDRVLARVTVTVDPPEAVIAVDGRPLAVEASGASPAVASAGVLPPGPGAPPPAPTFVLVLDPGAHLFTLSRKGFTDALVNRTFTPGSTSTLDLKLDLLPATLKVTSTQAGALVRVDTDDVGPAPVDVLRPAGSYKVQVRRDGFLTYTTQVTVQPGEEVKLNATLLKDNPSVLTRWWFWASAVGVVGAGALTTYLVTKPPPKPPPYDGGSTGWVVHPAAIRF
jgi:hypothetical protein